MTDIWHLTSGAMPFGYCALRGLVERVADWPFSTFHRLVAEGVYPLDWAGGGDMGLGYDD